MATVSVLRIFINGLIYGAHVLINHSLPDKDTYLFGAQSNCNCLYFPTFVKKINTGTLLCLKL